MDRVEYVEYCEGGVGGQLIKQSHNDYSRKGAERSKRGVIFQLFSYLPQHLLTASCNVISFTTPSVKLFTWHAKKHEGYGAFLK